MKKMGHGFSPKGKKGTGKTREEFEMQCGIKNLTPFRERNSRVFDEPQSVAGHLFLDFFVDT